MPPAIRQLVALSCQTARGTVRRPACGLLLLVAVVLSGLLPSLDLLSFLAKRALVAEAQLGMILLAGVLAAGLTVATDLGAELRRGAPELLAGALSPAVLAWGRFLGLAGALALVWVPLATAALWGSRVAWDDYHPDHAATRLFFGLVAGGVAAAAGLSRWRRVSFAAGLFGWLAVLLPLGLGLLVRLPRGPVSGAELIDWGLLAPLGLALPALGLVAAGAWLAACWFDGSAVLAATVGLFLAGLVLPARLAAGGWGWLGAAAVDLQPLWRPTGGATEPLLLLAVGCQIVALVTFTAAVLARRSGR